METPNDRIQRALREKMAAAWLVNLSYWMGLAPFSKRIASSWQTEEFIHEMVVRCTIGVLRSQRSIS